MKRILCNLRISPPHPTPFQEKILQHTCSDGDITDTAIMLHLDPS